MVTSFRSLVTHRQASIVLETLPLQLSWEETPPSVSKLIAQASIREDAFLIRRATRPVSSFYGSNFRMTYHALDYLLASQLLAPSSLLLEWGSGLGVVACQWAMLGGQAFGIEFDAELAAEAKRLAESHGLSSVRFAEGNFVPESGWARLDPIDDPAQLSRGGPCGYEQLGISLHDASIVFVYPWPGERRFIDDVFETCATPGTLMLSFHGGDELRLQRKT